MPIKSIQVKVFLMLLILTAALVLVLSLILRQGVSREFRHYKKSLDDGLVLHMVEKLQHHYKENNGWQQLQDNNNHWRNMIAKGARDISLINSNRRFQRFERMKGISMLDNSERKRLSRMASQFVLLDAKKKPIVGAQVNDGSPYLETPIYFNKEVVGFLFTKKPRQQRLEADKAFTNNIEYIFWLLGAGLLLLVAAASVPISRYFSKPVLQLIGATKKAAAGDYSVRADINRHDELGQLGQNFNLLASTLQSNLEVQKNMMADISHELRTPVAVLQAQVEALQDGVHQADDKNLGLLHQQITSLGHLINDLHQLSVADLGSMQYQMQSTKLVPIVNAAISAIQLSADDKNIRVNADISQHTKTAIIMGDAGRLQQMFSNLLVNSVTYTSKGGAIELQVTEDLADDVYVVEIKDSAPGLKPHEMAQMFDRLYRQEASRNKATGGSGLGLAIVKKIVEAHNGSITVEPSELGGVCMTVKLPKQA